ncbi:MAG TPA: hypothetical protein VM509_06800 [Planctomycetota bacterium]|nr:hypothetical protein [Planctomycetota bacterium]
MRAALDARRLDRWSLGAMALGLALVLQPWWKSGFQLGFAVTGAGVVLQIVAAHLPRKEGA